LVAIAVVPVAFANLPDSKKKKYAQQKNRSAEKGRPEAGEVRNPRLLKPISWLFAKGWRRAACMVFTLVATVAAFAFLTPPAEYLPEGEEAKAFSTMIAPPGYSLREMEKI